MSLDEIIARPGHRFPVLGLSKPYDKIQDSESSKGKVLYWKTNVGFRTRLDLEHITFFAWGFSAENALDELLHDINSHFDSLSLSPLIVNEIEYPVVDRRQLYDHDAEREGPAPLGVVHWWEKGEGQHRWFKCDIHLGETSYEALGDTLAQALENLSEHIDWATGDESLPPDTAKNESESNEVF